MVNLTQIVARSAWIDIIEGIRNLHNYFWFSRSNNIYA